MCMELSETDLQAYCPFYFYTMKSLFCRLDVKVEEWFGSSDFWQGRIKQVLPNQQAIAPDCGLGGGGCILFCVHKQYVCNVVFGLDDGLSSGFWPPATLVFHKKSGWPVSWIAVYLKTKIFVDSPLLHKMTSLLLNLFLVAFSWKHDNPSGCFWDLWFMLIASFLGLDEC